MALRTVRISKDELLQIRKIYENVMSYACYGLFFKEGEVLGNEIAKRSMEASKGDRGKYFEMASNLIAGRGWAEAIKFTENGAVVEDCIEVEKGAGHETCHLMRGMVKRIFEEIDDERYVCEETECVSKGDSKCVFVVKAKGV